MKKTLLFLLIIPFFIGCDGGSFNNRNPYIPNYNFSIEVNTNLPLYNNLQFPSNAVKVFQANAPGNGIIIFNTGSSYVAFDGSCPNQAISSCSSLTINGIEAVCPCDDAAYSLFTGQSPGLKYPLKQYRTEVSGSVIRVFN